MALIHELETLVSMHVKDCPGPVIEDAFRFVTRDFLRYTRWYRESRTVSVTADVNAYPVTASDDTNNEVIGIIAAVLEGEPLCAAVQEDVRPGDTGYYFFEPPNVLQLSWLPTDSIDDGLDVRVIVNIRRNAAEIPDLLLDRWDNYITYGVMNRLYGMKGSIWYDAAAEERYGARWAEGMQMAKYEADRQALALGFSGTEKVIAR